jgi:hypothetical protein
MGIMVGGRGSASFEMKPSKSIDRAPTYSEKLPDNRTANSQYRILCGLALILLAQEGILVLRLPVYSEKRERFHRSVWLAIISILYHS